MKNGGPARPKPLVDWAAYGRMHALRGEIWQLRLNGPWALLDARRLTWVARDRGVRMGGGPADGVKRLWLLGWLKADLVRTEPDVDETTLAERVGEGLLRVGEDGYGRPLYADARTAGRGGAAGRVGGLAKARIPEGVAPLFHAFRYHVLHRIEGVLRFNVSPISTLTTAGPESLGRLNERTAGRKDERFGSPSFAQDLEAFNDRATLAAAAEPLHFARLFGFRARETGYEPEELGISEEAYDALDAGERERLALALFDARFEEHRGAVREMFERAGLERVEGERRRLCEAARVVEPNADVHTLLTADCVGVDRRARLPA